MSTDYNYDEQVAVLSPSHTQNTNNEHRANSFPTSSSPSQHSSPYHFPILYSDRPRVSYRKTTRKLTRQLIDRKKDIEDTAPRINSDFKPTDDALIQGQKRKQWRRERRLKRILTVAVGWILIAVMMYLIAVTKTTVAKVWDPYDILEISRVIILDETLLPC